MNLTGTRVRIKIRIRSTTLVLLSLDCHLTVVSKDDRRSIQDSNRSAFLLSYYFHFYDGKVLKEVPSTVYSFKERLHGLSAECERSQVLISIRASSAVTQHGRAV